MAKPDPKSDSSNPNNVQLLQNMINQIESDKAKFRQLLERSDDYQLKIKAVIGELKKK